MHRFIARQVLYLAYLSDPTQCIVFGIAVQSIVFGRAIRIGSQAAVLLWTARCVALLYGW
jgi:hypothetical protein